MLYLELHSLSYKQPGPVSTLIYIVVGHPQQALLRWKIATARSIIYYTQQAGSVTDKRWLA